MHGEHGDAVTLATLVLGHRGKLVGTRPAPVRPQVEHGRAARQRLGHVDRIPVARALQGDAAQRVRAVTVPRGWAGFEFGLGPRSGQRFGRVRVPVVASHRLAGPGARTGRRIGIAQTPSTTRRSWPRPRRAPPRSSGWTCSSGVQRPELRARPTPAGARSPDPSPVEPRRVDPSGRYRTTGSPWPARTPRRPASWRGTPVGRERSPGG